MMKFDNKVVVITGGNSGIGLASAKRFHELGASIAISSRSAEKLDAAKVELGDAGIRGDLVSPGPIPTPGMDRLGLPEDELEKAKAGFASIVPLGRC